MSSQFVCEFRNTLYGLKHVSRACFNRIMQALFGWGITNLCSDVFLFMYNLEGILLILLVYADDTLSTGNNSTIMAKLVNDLNCGFALN